MIGEPSRMRGSTSPTALLIAYHYPPCAVSSGLQRTLAYSIHLQRHGWSAVVLTVDPRVYDRASGHQLQDIPSNVPVERAFALDVAKDLAIRGRYWSRLALPDRWRSWWLSAVPRGLRLIRRHNVQVIWSTYPIATAHLIGATLARMSGVPWVADFRDPMVEYFPELGQTFPQDPVLRHSRLRVERRAMRRAARAVFCTDGARDIVQERYPEFSAQHLHVIPNGYEERAFGEAEAMVTTPPAAGARRVLLHSGVVYPGADRDPTALFVALRSLASAGIIHAGNFELRLRDPSHVEHFTRLAAAHDIAALVSILPPLPYREALAEMLQADGLLLLQGVTSNPAIPAKLYEYLRARRPLLGLVHPDGESAKTLRKVGIDSVCPLTDSAAIEALLRRWWSGAPAIQLPEAQQVVRYSREAQTETLARLFDEVSRDARAQVPSRTASPS